MFARRRVTPLKSHGKTENIPTVNVTNNTKK